MKLKSRALVDFTQGNIMSLLWRFGIPMLIGNLFQQLYTIVDSMLLGKLVSPQALAAAGTVTPLVHLILGIISGFTLGTSLVAAGLMGKKDTDRLQKLIESTFLADMGIGILLAAVAFSFTRPILIAIKTPADVLVPATRYLRIIALGMMFQCLYQYMTDVLRGLGDSQTPLLFLLMSTVMNIILDTVFIVVFRMDVSGVAYATVVSQIAAAVGCVIYSTRKYDCFKLNLRISRIDGSLLRRSLSLGVPSAMQQTVGSLGALGMQSVVNSFGSVAMNGYGAAYKVDNFIMLPITTMGISLGTFVAQNVGAGNMDRVREGLKKTSITCSVMSVAFSAVIFVFAEWFVGLFVKADQVEIITLGARGLRILAVPYVLCSQANIFLNFFKGAGDVQVAFIASLGQVIVRLSICFGLSPIPSIGMNAVWFSMPVTWVVLIFFCALYYRSGAWKKAMAKHA